jgi:hypothetical protein
MICDRQQSGAVELYFYDELPAEERLDMDRHFHACAECREALDELKTIRSALAARPDVSAPAGGDWSAFMARLERSTEQDARAGTVVQMPPAGPLVMRRHAAGPLAMAALLTLVTASVGYLAFHRPPAASPPRTASSGVQPAEPGSTVAPPEDQGTASAAVASPNAAFEAVSEQHFERSKLVILGLATKDPQHTTAEDWAYERQLAGSLLDDTRLYKQAAEERGLGSLARVMGDLELVLLQTSLPGETDAATLHRLQRLIQKRDLVTRMEMTRF